LSLYDDDYYFKKADRLRDCASLLVFDQLDDNSLEHLKLAHMSSCRVRLCPMCAWRRTLKIGSNARKIFTCVETDQQYKDKYTYLFLTLTVPNCVGAELSSTIDWMFSAFNLLMQRDEVKKVVKGYYRGLEVTHNHIVGNKSYDTYHPHFHVILVVEKSYLEQKKTERGYLTQRQWQHLWGESLGWFLPRKFVTQKEYINKMIGDFKKYKKYKEYKYNCNKVDVSKLPKKQQEYIATHLWNQWCLTRKRAKPRPYFGTKRLSNDEYCQLIKKYSNPHGVLCEAERMLAVKSVGHERKNCVRYGFAPAVWLYNYNYDNLVCLLANRLCLQVDIRAVKPKDKNINSSNPLERSGLINSICEVTKYTVKDKDYIIPSNWSLSADIVSVLDDALDRRRLVAWGGILGIIHKKLNLDDEIDGDLIHIDDDENSSPTANMQAYFIWNTGYQQYVLHSIKPPTLDT
jgi:plasmid rolling circle replication initiator protein Rep